jgi:hypothetical protein
MEMLITPAGRKFAEAAPQAHAFQQARAAKETESTPAGWLTGDMALKPKPDLAGNVRKVRLSKEE